MTVDHGGTLRLLLYSHDTYGLGHLRRNLAIAKHLLGAIPDLQIVLLTGSPSADRFPVPPGLSLVRLPPVVKVAVDEYRAREPGLDFGHVRRARAAMIADVARRFAPDLFLVDHAPQGMKGELLPAFNTLHRFSPRTRIVLGLRDVIDNPVTVRASWDRAGVMETLERVYDRIMVYGSREMFDVATAYGFSPAVRARTAYTGYLWRTPVPPARELLPSGYLDEPFVLGMAGGGGDGYAVLAATLRAAETLGLRSLLVTGPLMAPAERMRLVEAVRASRHGHVLEFHPCLESVVSAARAVVTMGGYNSLCEIVPTGVAAIVVPRTWPRREQAIRAELFAAHGLARMVVIGSALETQLAAALAEAFAMPRRVAITNPAEGFERLCRLLLAEVERPGALAIGASLPSDLLAGVTA